MHIQLDFEKNGRLNARFFLLLVEAVLIVCLASDCATPRAATKPNFVVIVADDMGFSDAGCYGGEIQTPNLDRLASNGLRFTQFYNTARCWSSRACLLTGYYAQQVRRDALPGVPGGVDGKRPAWASLLPSMLREAGYRSYHSGKWHVDGPVLAGGFDHSYCITDFDRYFNPKEHTLDDQPLPPVKLGSGYYSTTAIARNAIDMLADHQAAYRGQPFFLYLAFLSPHYPLHALPEDMALYKDRYRAGWDVLRQERFARMKDMGLIHCPLSKLDSDIIPRWNLPEQELRERIGPGEAGHAVPWDSLTDEQKEFQPVKMALHAAMIHRMDIEIGRVIDQLKKMGVLDNTVVFFLSDNGASAEQIIRGDGHDRNAAPGSAGTFLSIGPGWSSAANTPFRLHKSWVHEGGISTPLIVQWPKGISARGELRDNPGHLIDLAPTILELAGVPWPETVNRHPVPEPPGKSLVPVFSRDDSVKHDYFWWFHDGNRAIRIGDWKLVADHQKPFELYDMRTDRSESHNLAADHPEKIKELSAAWRRHEEEFRLLATEDLPPGPSAKNDRQPKNPSD
jgi:arylsulfatase A-like enzyme